jgi:hypothetical protein
VTLHIKAKNYHRSIWELLLYHGCVDTHDREWVQNELLDAGMSWSKVQERFLAQYRTAALTSKYHNEFVNLDSKRFPTPQAFNYRVAQLISRFGGSMTEYTTIKHVESSLPAFYKEKVMEVKYKSQIQQASAAAAASSSTAMGLLNQTLALSHGSEFRFTTLTDLFNVITNISVLHPHEWSKAYAMRNGDKRVTFAADCSHQPYPRTFQRRGQGYQRNRDNNGHDNNNNTVDSSRIPIPRNSKLEPSASGQPTRVGSKHKGKSKTPTPHRHAVPTSPARPGVPTAQAPSFSVNSANTTTSHNPHNRPAAPAAPGTHKYPANAVPTCATCNKRGHTTAEHIDNFKPECDVCKGSHTTRNHDRINSFNNRSSASFRPPRQSVIRIDDQNIHILDHEDRYDVLPAPVIDAPTVARAKYAGQQNNVFITVAECNNYQRQFTHLNLDSGADLSCINLALVHHYQLPVSPPTGVLQVAGFQAGMTISRIGTVVINLTVHLPLLQRSVVSFRKTFEVVDMKQDDFLIGRDILPTLFPNNDLLMCTPSHSPITDTPQHVSYGPPSSIDIENEDDSDSDNDSARPTVAAASSSSSSSAPSSSSQ